MREGTALAAVAAVFVLGAAAACLQPSAQVCADGQVCAADLACAPAGGGCVDPRQVEACVDKLDGASCEFGLGVGACEAGVCVLGGCGDGDADVGEVCDDGNIQSGDGCRADCGKLEVCGDQLVDAGEACDDGNINPVDGCDACVASTWSAEALLAGAIDATSVMVGATRAAFTIGGDLVFTDPATNRVRRVAWADGTITTVAGSGEEGSGGDGGPATAAAIENPVALAVDGLDNVYVVDGGRRVRRVDGRTGTITTIAGTGQPGSSGDGGPATAATFTNLTGVAVDGLGNVVVADGGASRIRRIAAGTGIIATIVGDAGPGFSGDGGPASAAQLSGPSDVAFDRRGALFIVDGGNVRIRRVDPTDGSIATIAGGGATTGDGGPATEAALGVMRAIAVGPDDDVFLVQLFGHRVRRVAADGTISTVIGTGQPGDSGDDGPAVEATLSYPEGVAVDGDGNVCVAEGRVRCASAATGILTALAGTSSAIAADEGLPATAVAVAPYGQVAVDADGNVLFADPGAQRVRRVDAIDGTIRTVVGTGDGEQGSADGQPALATALFYPQGVAVDASGRVYVADTASNRVRRVGLDGTVEPVAGTGAPGYAGDGGLATAAQLTSPTRLHVTPAGDVYIVDGNHVIRRVLAATGIIETVAGTGAAPVGVTADGGLATATDIAPASVVVAPSGVIYFTDASSHRIRRIDPADGRISTIAGTGTAGATGDGDQATLAQLHGPTGIALDAAGDLLIADAGNARLRRVASDTGIITTIAGTGVDGRSGDGGAAALARLAAPVGLDVGSDGDIVIGEPSSARVRRIDAASGRISTIAGRLDPDGTGPLDRAVLAAPAALVATARGTFFASRGAYGVQAILPGAGALSTVAGRYPHELATGALARFRDQGFGAVGGVAFDPSAGRHGVLYLSETSAGRIHAVTIVDPDDAETWTIVEVAGSDPGFADGDVATARFDTPRGLAFEPATRTLYVADAGNHVIRAIEPDRGVVTTVVGEPRTLGYFGDGGPAVEALLHAPSAVGYAPNGDLYVADTDNHRVRRVTRQGGVISTVLGDGVAASSGEGVPSSAFPVHAPRGLAVDEFGNLYVTSSTSVRLLPADAAGVVDGGGPVQTVYGAAPRDAFPASATTCLTGVAVIDLATVWITDACVGLLVELRRRAVGDE